MYKLTNEGWVWKFPDTKVPIMDSEDNPNTNPDYLEYKAWLTAGNIPEPADPITPEVPQTISPLQAKAELLTRGLLDDVEALVTTSANLIMPLAWDAASEFNRQSPMILSIAQAMGWDDDYLDDMFQQAAKRTF